MNHSILRNLAFYALMFFVVWTVADYMSGSHQTAQATALGYSDFTEKVTAGDVDKVVIVQNNIRGTLKDGTEFTTIAPDAPSNDRDLYTRLSEKGVTISAENPPEPPWWQTLLTSLIPIALLIGFWFFIMQQSQMGGGRMMNFGKSRVRLMVSDKKKVTFADVAGADEAKQELEEVVEFLKTPDKFNELGARIPKGVLLFGPPGTGKTLLAKAVAGEAGVQFFTISGSDFVEMFVGVGASRVRDLFKTAKEKAPCIIFIDEIDAVGRARGRNNNLGGNDERENTLNQLLTEMDGFEGNSGVIILAATNRPDVLDPALLRPGRFDRQIVVDKPDVRGREAILKVHTKGKPVADDVDLDVLARRTPGFTGADLSNLVNEAALLAARRDKKKITMAEMEEAIERVLAGPERKSHVMTDEEKRLTAYHEGGHTLVGLLLEHADPVHKVTIIPRGRAGGYMLSLPKEDRSYRTRSELIDRIKVALGGRVAEEVVLGEISTGASSDIQQATRIIRSMIMEYGMSDAIGPIAYGEENHQVFLGRDLNRERNYSEEIAGEIDREVRRYIEEAYEACRTIIVENRDKLDLIAKELLERETLSAAELEELMTKGAISEKDKQNDDTDDTGKPAPIPVDVVIDDSTQTSEEAERAAEKRPAPVAAPEPKFNVTQWDK